MSAPKGVKQHKYTEEEHQFILDHTEGITSPELADMFYARFGVRIAARAFNSYRKRYGLKCGVNCQFKKDAAPNNKGKKQTEYMSADGIKRSSVTRFKKGQTPVNHRPVGSERINVDGYIEIKVAEPNKWMTKNRYLWQQKYGSIPKGYVIIYKNGNRLDDRIENLALITNGELARLNRSNLQRGLSEEADDAIINLAKINAAIGRRKKNGRGM